MKHNPPHKPYWEMSLEELREATKEFDKPFVIDTFRPLTPAERAKWERIKRKPGRPRVGQGAQVVSVSIERSLLKAADAVARKRKVSRARLIAEGLQHVVASSSKPRTAKPKPRRKAA